LETFVVGIVVFAGDEVDELEGLFEKMFMKEFDSLLGLLFGEFLS